MKQNTTNKYQVPLSESESDSEVSSSSRQSFNEMFSNKLSGEETTISESETNKINSSEERKKEEVVAVEEETPVVESEPIEVV